MICLFLMIIILIYRIVLPTKVKFRQRSMIAYYHLRENDQWLLCLYVVILERDYMFNNHKSNISNFENQCTIFSVIVKTKSYLFYIRNTELKCFIFFVEQCHIKSFIHFVLNFNWLLSIPIHIHIATLFFKIHFISVLLM